VTAHPSIIDQISARHRVHVRLRSSIKRLGGLVVVTVPSIVFSVDRGKFDPPSMGKVFAWGSTT
jgi:hypothetical protein